MQRLDWGTESSGNTVFYFDDISSMKNSTVMKQIKRMGKTIVKRLEKIVLMLSLIFFFLVGDILMYFKQVGLEVVPLALFSVIALNMFIILLI